MFEPCGGWPQRKSRKQCNVRRTSSNRLIVFGREGREVTGATVADVRSAAGRRGLARLERCCHQATRRARARADSESCSMRTAGRADRRAACREFGIHDRASRPQPLGETPSSTHCSRDPSPASHRTGGGTDRQACQQKEFVRQDPTGLDRLMTQVQRRPAQYRSRIRFNADNLLVPWVNDR